MNSDSDQGVLVPGGTTSWMPLARRITWTAGVLVLVILAARFFVRDAVPIIQGQSEANKHYWPHWGWVLTHLTAGATALVGGALQWYTRLHANLNVVHRWIGRFYVAGVTVAGLTALYLAPFALPDMSFGIPLMVLAVAWLGSTWMALFAIRKRRVAVHRRWVARSYVFTLTFVVFRFVVQLPGLSVFGDLSAAVAAWISLIVPIAILELWMRGRTLSRRGLATRFG